MGMELVAYIKNRDGEPLKFRESDGHCDNGVFIDFWGGSGWITGALHYLTEPKLLTVDAVMALRRDAERDAAKLGKRAMRLEMALNGAEADDIGCIMEMLEEAEENLAHIEAMVKVLWYWETLAENAELWVVLSY